MKKAFYSVIDPSQRKELFRGKCALTVMAKVPKPGRVKTRLSPPLSSEQCAAINSAFLKDTLACLGHVSEKVSALPVVSYTPIGEEAGFQGIVPAGTHIVAQPEGDFGVRLSGTAEALLQAGFSAVCLIDSDSPTVPNAAYETAVQILLKSAKQTAVLGPSSDGGYYLIGMNSFEPDLFRDVRWSTAVVAKQTRERAIEANLELHDLMEWYDVDDLSSLVRLKDEFEDEPKQSGYEAPSTRKVLRAILQELPPDWQRRLCEPSPI